MIKGVCEESRKRIMEFEYFDGSFRKRHRLSNNQFCEVRFGEYVYDEYVLYNVAFAVANKKKTLSAWFDEEKGGSDIDLKITGGNCIESLMWCKDMILEFEKFIISHVLDVKETNPVAREFLGVNRIKIMICADDAKRLRAYRYMTRYGYVEKLSRYGRILIKTINI